MVRGDRAGIFDWISSTKSGVFVVYLKVNCVVDHAVALDAMRWLILDGSEE